MHHSAFEKMKECVDKYVKGLKSPVIVDFGSRIVASQKKSHRDLFNEIPCKYVGLDVIDGKNVDIVMTEPYKLPLEDNFADIVITGQVIQHIPYFWVSFMEMARILKKGGLIFCTAPSRGHIHSPPYDCWRFYPDGYKAIAVFAGLHLIEARTDFPPRQEQSNRFNYAAINENRYWGDTLGIFQKTASYDEKKISGYRAMFVEWANERANVTEINSSSASNAPLSVKEKYIKHGNFNVKIPFDASIITAPVEKAILEGYYEAKEARAAAKYVKPGSRVLELGGGLGFMSAVLREKKPSSYIVVEADDRLIPIIQRTHKLNGVENVLVHNCVVTSSREQLERGFCQLQMGNQFWGSSVKQKKGSGNYVKVQTVSLNAYLKNYNPNVLLIDIEGAEEDLFYDTDLNGVELIIMETHRAVIGNSGVDKVISQLNDVDFVIKESFNENQLLVFSRASQ